MNSSSWLFTRRFCLTPLSNPSTFIHARLNPAFRSSHRYFTPHNALSTSAASTISTSSRAPVTAFPSLLQRVSNRLKSAVPRFGRSQRLTSQYGRVRPPTPSGGSQGDQGGGGFREQFDRIPHSVILWSVLGLNGIVFAAWQLAGINASANGDQTWFVFLRNNFTTGYRNLKSGRVWTLLTAAFSHQDVSHILFNAFTFYFMAPSVLTILGNTGFMALYFVGGLSCSAVSMVWNTFIKGNYNYSSHGASGAIYAVVSFLACAAPRMTFQLYGIIPIPAWACVSGIFLWDSYQSLNSTGGRTDTAGHVGGLLAGALAFIALRFRLI